MGRIIKLTESQLRDVVQRVINEQKASPNASAAAKQVWTKLSIAQADDDSAALISAISMIKSVELYTEVVNMMRGASSIGYYKSIVQLLNGELGAYDVPTFKQIQAILKKIGVTITAQIKKAGDGKTDYLETGSIRQMIGPAKPAPVVTPPKPGETDPTKPTYRICKAGAFPLMYGCKQTEVGYVQQCLGLKVDYSFGPATLQGLVGYAPMKNGSTPEALKKQYATIGLSKQEFDLIRTKYCKAKPKKIQDKKKVEAPVVDTRDKRVPLELPSKLVSPMPVNIDIPKLRAIPTPGIDPTRKEAILAQIKDRGFDKVYKGQALTPEEKTWLSSQMGTDPNKDKAKAGGDEKLRFSNT
jgi:hypothetical protein